MAVLFSSLSARVMGTLRAAKAVVMGTLRAAKAVVMEISPPAATLACDIVAAAWASVAWLIGFLWAFLASAAAMAVNTLLPYALTAAWSAVRASQVLLGVALGLLSYAWTLSSGVVAGAVRAAKGVAAETLRAAVTLVGSVAKAAWASVAWLLCHLQTLLSAAAAVATDTLPRAAAAAEYAVGASKPCLDLASKFLYGLYGRLVTVAVEELPGVARAAMDVAWSAVEASQPWLETVSRRSRDLYGWLVATAAEKLQAGGAFARAVAIGEFSSEAAAVVARIGSKAEASGARLHERLWFLVHDHGVAVYVLLGLALLAVAFVCGGVCALALIRSHLQDHERNQARRRQRSRHPHLY